MTLAATARHSTVRSGPVCPQDASHGRLLDWPGERTGFYCSSARHTGGAFYTTDLIPVPRSARRDAAPIPVGGDSDGLTAGSGRPVLVAGLSVPQEPSDTPNTVHGGAGTSPSARRRRTVQP